MSDAVHACSFCSKGSDQVAFLIVDGDMAICDEDVARAEHGFRDANPSDRCSFCGRTDLSLTYSAGSIRPGPPTKDGGVVVICDACVKSSRSVIDDLEISEAIQVELKASGTATAVKHPVQGARCPSCRAVLAESARSQFVDVPGDGDATAQVLFLYCSNCGHTLDDVILPSE